MSAQPPTVETIEGFVPEAAEPAGPDLLARVGAELLGTFFVVFVGVGTYLFAPFSDIGGKLGIALVTGFAVVAAMATAGRVSGGHVNPAVTLGAAISGRLSWADVLPYWLAQLVGGALATATLYLVTPSGLGELLQLDAGNRGMFSNVANGYAEHSPLGTLLANQQITSDAQSTLWAVLLVEAVATAALVAVYLVSTKATSSAQRAPFVVGLAFAALLLVTTPLTNGSVNPARATAVAIFAETWSLKQLWVFWVAPLVGAAVAAALHRVFSSPALTGPDEPDEPYLDDDEADDPFQRRDEADGTPDADDVTGTSDEPTGPTALS